MDTVESFFTNTFDHFLLIKIYFIIYKQGNFLKKKNKMCALCGNQLERTYTHSKTSLHRKKLFQIFKEIKKKSYFI